MRITVLANYLSSSRGGIERSLYEVCQGLVNRGHELSLVYVEDGEQTEEYQKFCKVMVKVGNYQISRKDIFVDSARFMSDVFRANSIRADVVYSSQYNNFFFSALLSSLQRIPFVAHVRLPAPKEKGILKDLKRRATLNRIDRFIAISKQLKRDWAATLSLDSNLIDVIYNATDTDKFVPTNNLIESKQEWGIQSLEDNVVTYVGRLDPHKGVDTLIKAVKLLIDQGKPIRLLIAGKSLVTGESYETYLKQLACDLDIAEHITFLGHISDTAALYQASDVSVLPSVWPEPFGRVIIEALACGVPVVASNTGGIPEILTGELKKNLFQAGDESELAATLSRVIDWRTDSSDLANHCREHVIQNFSFDTLITNVESSLSQALSKR